MPEQPGSSAPGDARQTRQAELAAWAAGTAAANAALAQAVRDAYTATAAARERIDAIAGDIDDAAADPSAFAVDTPLGVRELQRFLAGKNRELIDVVAGAQHDDAVKRLLLESLRPGYSKLPPTT
ncbi:MAG TPA: DUF4226 domain-containing protein [Mycobacterium sp.]|nr:DUF4226 domain-containing protein [Mycobacterium sp.]